MFKWWKRFLNRPYDKVVEEIEDKLYGKVSEPVVSIVKSFDEKGRWVIKANFNIFQHNASHSFSCTDTKTGESLTFNSNSHYHSHNYTAIPSSINRFHLPSWMTDGERRYVQDEFEKRMSKLNDRFERVKDRQRKASDAVHEINKRKERQRVMSIYCKEG